MPSVWIHTQALIQTSAYKGSLSPSLSLYLYSVKRIIFTDEIYCQWEAMLPVLLATLLLPS